MPHRNFKERIDLITSPTGHARTLPQKGTGLVLTRDARYRSHSFSLSEMLAGGGLAVPRGVVATYVRFAWFLTHSKRTQVVAVLAIVEHETVTVAVGCRR